MHDERRDVIVIAFRGTKDPVDLITDITFFSTAFAPRQATSPISSLLSLFLSYLSYSIPPFPKEIDPHTTTNAPHTHCLAGLTVKTRPRPSFLS